MNRKTMLWTGAAGAALLLAQANAAFAASPPKFSGTYIVNYIETCQAAISEQGDAGSLSTPKDLNGLNGISNGKITHTIMALKFTQTGALVSGTWSGTLAMTAGWQTKGDLWQDMGQTVNSPTTMSTGAAQAPGTSWANTANTVKFSGTSVGGPYSITFNVLFGPVSSGIAQSAMFSGIPDGPSACGASATMIRSGS